MRGRRRRREQVGDGKPADDEERDHYKDDRAPRAVDGLLQSRFALRSFAVTSTGHRLTPGFAARFSRTMG